MHVSMSALMYVCKYACKYVSVSALMYVCKYACKYDSMPVRVNITVVCRLNSWNQSCKRCLPLVHFCRREIGDKGCGNHHIKALTADSLMTYARYRSELCCWKRHSKSCNLWCKWANQASFLLLMFQPRFLSYQVKYKRLFLFPILYRLNS